MDPSGWGQLVSGGGWGGLGLELCPECGGSKWHSQEVTCSLLACSAVSEQGDWAGWAEGEVCVGGVPTKALRVHLGVSADKGSKLRNAMLSRAYLVWTLGASSPLPPGSVKVAR